MEIRVLEGKNISEIKKQIFEIASAEKLPLDSIIIMNTTEETKGILSSFGIGKKVLKVVVGIEKSPKNIGTTNSSKTMEPVAKASTPTTPTQKEVNKEVESLLLNEIREMKQLLKENIQEKQKTITKVRKQEENLQKLRNFLLERDFDKIWADNFVRSLKSELRKEDLENFELLLLKAKEKIAEGILTTGGKVVVNSLPKVLFFVGPTGVGKTTTLVKLAAHLCLKESPPRPFAFVTLDKYKIGGAEQLKAYADMIFTTPFKAVTKPPEFKDTISMLKSNYEYIFVDTAGTNQKNSLTIKEMGDFINYINEDKEVFLVLSATSKYKDLVEIMERYEVLKYSSIIVTKIDETNTLGALLSALHNSGKRISFLGTGQRVPEDLEIAEVIKLVNLAFR